MDPAAAPTPPAWCPECGKRVVERAAGAWCPRCQGYLYQHETRSYDESGGSVSLSWRVKR